MSLLGFGDGGLSDSLSLSHNRYFEGNCHPGSKPRVLAAGSHIDVAKIFFSCSFVGYIQAEKNPFHRRPVKCQSTSLLHHCGRNLHTCHALQFLGGLHLSVGTLRSLFHQSKGPKKIKTVEEDIPKITIALWGNSDGRTSNSKRRLWTNVLIGLNVLMFVVQEASHGRLLLLGAKVNSLIDSGQWWRFVTPAFLHASLPHLLTNCYSLNSIGPVIEAQGGAARFLAVYFGSAITGFVLSYSFTQAPAVGASGAVFGLVGSLAVFLLRHKDILTGAQQSLSNLSRMIVINLVLGLATSKIDNWGHFGGLLGGAAISWLVGPSFSYKRVDGERRMVLVDRPPVSFLLPRGRKDEP